MIVDISGVSTRVAMFFLMGVVGVSGGLESFADSGGGCSCGGGAGGDVVAHGGRFRCVP